MIGLNWTAFLCVCVHVNVYICMCVCVYSLVTFQVQQYIIYSSMHSTYIKDTLCPINGNIIILLQYYVTCNNKLLSCPIIVGVAQLWYLMASPADPKGFSGHYYNAEVYHVTLLLCLVTANYHIILFLNIRTASEI